MKPRWTRPASRRGVATPASSMTELAPRCLPLSALPVVHANCGSLARLRAAEWLHPQAARLGPLSQPCVAPGPVSSCSPALWSGYTRTRLGQFRPRGSPVMVPRCPSKLAWFLSATSTPHPRIPPLHLWPRGPSALGECPSLHRAPYTPGAQLAALPVGHTGARRHLRAPARGIFERWTPPGARRSLRAPARSPGSRDF